MRSCVRRSRVPPARWARPTDPVRVEGAARGLEALTRVNGKLAPLSADTRSRLFAVVENQHGTAAKGWPGRGGWRCWRFAMRGRWTAISR